VPRNTAPTTALECVGGPFDGDTIACGDGTYVEVSWGGMHRGSYVHGRQGDRRVLVWVPA
jgi:hypothetical protein